MARMKNQANDSTCQKPNFSWPAAATPFQISVVATSQRLEKSGATPSRGRAARAPATKTTKIQG
jgi:hypothetical protein